MLEMSVQPLRVGIIGAGEVAQVIHLPTLSLLSRLYIVVAICDISQQSVDLCAKKYHIGKATTSAQDLFNDRSIDVIFNLTSDEYHETYTVAALRAGKHVMLEKPLTLSVESAERIIEAEKEAVNDARVFVGYMRRYAPSFVKAFKREVAGIDRILYARCRGIVGPNAYFVSQSGTSAQKFTAVPSVAISEKQKLLSGLVEEAFDATDGVTKAQYNYCRFLGSLGSHDLSLMREVLGMPDSVSGVSVNEPFYSAILNYVGKDDHRFSATYESGIDAVARFDSHLAVYGEKKTVSIQYDTPYVKGLPIKVRVDERNEFDEVVTREILSSYEDAYTAELAELHACLTEGKEIKTSAEDAINELRLFTMFYRRWEQQERDARFESIIKVL
ncbi:MAG: hypothetical protein HETSPECPRED_000971 [Heterodermia speciosa]|uniref:Gfo/Idh/MocA-like oxidoreductase N-terminal domain-containing protein n=1 Tax=Heterodermia speciosa TaxID=116794 RepID=A0A8H3EVS9_9LECA|nr:MAG: hypothetical protein HETSPECPRED_000971 [Heterodermia speciosa]